MALLITHTSWKIVSAIATLAFISTDAIGSECAGAETLKANATIQSFVFNNLAETHPKKMDCEWHITTGSNSSVVAVQLSVFILPGTQSNCSSDYVEFYDGTSNSSSRIRLLCGDFIGGTLSSTNSDLTLVFHSEGLNANGSIFTFLYQAMTKHSETTGSCKNISLVANKTPQFLLSPNYPDWYFSNMDCVWHITADLDSNVVWLEIHDIALEPYIRDCTTDYVKIYYGPSTNSGDFKIFCYKWQDIYISTNSSMTVVFHSNEQNNFKGFNFTYTSHTKPVRPDNRPDHTVLIIVSITCGLGLISFFATLVGCIMKRMARRRQRNLQENISYSNSTKEKTNRSNAN